MNILITGVPGEGKSTLAAVIAKMLRDRGHKADVYDDARPEENHPGYPLSDSAIDSAIQPHEFQKKLEVKITVAEPT